LGFGNEIHLEATKACIADGNMPCIREALLEEQDRCMEVAGKDTTTE